MRLKPIFLLNQVRNMISNWNLTTTKERGLWRQIYQTSVKAGRHNNAARAIVQLLQTYTSGEGKNVYDESESARQDVDR